MNKQDYGDAFLFLHFSEREIYVRSTDINLTLLSAESTLAGLYPPKGNHIWSMDIPWQPIPVHTVELEADNLLYVYPKCPRMTELDKDVLNSKEMKKINEASNNLPGSHFVRSL